MGAAIATLRVDFPLCTALAGGVQRGGFLFKDFWTRIVFWSDTCLVELTKSYVLVAKSYVQFQSLMFQVAKFYAQFQSLMFR